MSPEPVGDRLCRAASAGVAPGQESWSVDPCQVEEGGERVGEPVRLWQRPQPVREAKGSPA